MCLINFEVADIKGKEAGKSRDLMRDGNRRRAGGTRGEASAGVDGEDGGILDEIAEIGGIGPDGVGVCGDGGGAVLPDLVAVMFFKNNAFLYCMISR